MDQFKEKAQNLVLDSSLREFPVVFELYARAFEISLDDLDSNMAAIISIVRNAEDQEQAARLVRRYLNTLEPRI